MLQSHTYCHTLVTSDDKVTVMVTSYKVIEKNIKGFEKIILYNILTLRQIHGHLG